jgi:transposase
MAYRYGNRKQAVLFPQSIEEYIEDDAPVRAYDVIVDSLNFEGLGIDWDPRKIGCPQYDPRIMLKLLVYGYSYGIRSSRKLERETHYNLSFIWLTGGLKPDHKTIAEFRRKNKKALSQVLKQCARLCIDLDLIAGNTLFIDGSKIKANASIKKIWTKERCRNWLERIDTRIAEILSECEAVDVQEEGQGSLIKMKEELKSEKVIKSKIQHILKRLRQEDRKTINTTDPDSSCVKGTQGFQAGYNVQAVVDEKNGLIVHSEAVRETTDNSQFAKQVDKANETIGEKCKTACADCGYANIDEMEKVDKQGIKVVIPSIRQVSDKEISAFYQGNFRYDRNKDCFICPTGHVLNYSYTDNRGRRKVYIIKGSICKQCRHFGVCTKSKTGRRVNKFFNEDVKRKFEVQYKEPESQQIYKLRKQKVEIPFGHIKRNLKADAFLLRGLAGVRAEVSILASCFNIARMISILGVSGLIARLTA